MKQNHSLTKRKFSEIESLRQTIQSTNKDTNYMGSPGMMRSETGGHLCAVASEMRRNTCSNRTIDRMRLIQLL